MKPKIIICQRVLRKNINSVSDYVLLPTESATLTQSFGKSDAGNYFKQKLNIVADIDSDTADELQTIPQLFKLTDSEGNEFTWGDTTYKCRCENCEREMEHTQIGFYRVSVTSDI